MFSAKTQESGKHPLHSIRLARVKGKYLVPGPVSIFKDGLLISEDENASRPAKNVSYAYRDEKDVTVSFSPAEKFTDENYAPYEVVDLKKERLTYKRAATRKYTVTNTGAAKQIVYTTILEDVPKKWDVDGGSKESEQQIRVGGQTLDSAGKEVAGEGKLTLTRIDPKKHTTDIRAHDLDKLGSLTKGRLLAVVKTITSKRQAIKESDDDRTKLLARKTQLEADLYGYPVIMSSSGNVQARRALRNELALIRAEIRSKSAKMGRLDSEIQATLLTPAYRLALPKQGDLYHGVYAPKPGKTQADSSETQKYEEAVGKGVAWVFMDSDLFSDPDFPEATADEIATVGKTPFIRLSVHNPGDRSGTTLQEILDGKFDEMLVQWGKKAQGIPRSAVG